VFVLVKKPVLLAQKLEIKAQRYREPKASIIRVENCLQVANVNFGSAFKGSSTNRTYLRAIVPI
jgi:hypothetical protein